MKHFRFAMNYIDMNTVRANVWTDKGASSKTFSTAGQAQAWVNTMKMKYGN